MLFSQNMCFFKKHRTTPRAISISAPIPQKYDYANGELPPYHRTCTAIAVATVPIPPPKVYHTKQPPAAPARPPPPPYAPAEPRPLPPTNAFDSYWEYGNQTVPDTVAPVHLPPTPRGARPSVAPSVASSATAVEGQSRKGSLARGLLPRRGRWAADGQYVERRALFCNAGLDEHGRLKLDYVEVGDDGSAWETPDEYYTRAERKAARRRGQWSDNY